jgi:hypothetical protein
MVYSLSVNNVPCDPAVITRNILRYDVTLMSRGEEDQTSKKQINKRLALAKKTQGFPGILAGKGTNQTLRV